MPVKLAVVPVKVYSKVLKDSIRGKGGNKPIADKEGCFVQIFLLSVGSIAS